jgi:hypothetical protein
MCGERAVTFAFLAHLADISPCHISKSQKDQKYIIYLSVNTKISQIHFAFIYC